MESPARKKVLAISGSTRSHSSNEAILRFIANAGRHDMEVELYEGLSDLPHFNPDIDKQAVPAIINQFRQRIEKADGVIICTPEYVFSPPAVLKNALEWTVSTMAFSGKPVALIVASGVGEKTFESLTLILQTLGAHIGEHSRLLIQGPRSKLTSGELKEEITIQEIKKLIASLTDSMSLVQK